MGNLTLHQGLKATRVGGGGACKKVPLNEGVQGLQLEGWAPRTLEGCLCQQGGCKPRLSALSAFS